MKKITLGTAEIRLDSLAVVEDAATAISPTMFHVTCTANKLGKPDHVTVAILCSSPFKEISELVQYALENLDVESMMQEESTEDMVNYLSKDMTKEC